LEFNLKYLEACCETQRVKAPSYLVEEREESGREADPWRGLRTRPVKGAMGFAFGGALDNLQP
jgi:hypothetical protein